MLLSRTHQNCSCSRHILKLGHQLTKRNEYRLHGRRYSALTPIQYLLRDALDISNYNNGLSLSTRHQLQLHTQSNNEDPGPSNNSPRPQLELTDSEWELKTGRAIDILQENYKTFFSTGLVSTSDPSDAPAHLHLNRSKGLGSFTEGGIYSSRIKLEYTPPIALPSPFPRVLAVEGLHLYVASSTFVRHTLGAFYTDLEVDVRKVTVQTPTPGSHGHEDDMRDARKKRVTIGIGVMGQSRIGGKPAEWDIVSTYTFSSLTGLIVLHTVNSIHPAPHETMIDALRSTLLNLGLAGQGSIKGTNADAGAAVVMDNVSPITSHDPLAMDGSPAPLKNEKLAK